MGVSWDDFWRMNPAILSRVAEGYKMRLEQQDFMNWMSGQYVLSAVTVGVERNLAGRKSKAEYAKEPILQLQKAENRPPLEDDLQRQRELFVEKLKTMQANFELTHPKGKKGGEGEVWQK